MADEPKNIESTDAEPLILDQAALDALLAAGAAEPETLASGDAFGRDDLADDTPLGVVDDEGLLLQTPSAPSAISATIEEAAAEENSVSLDALDFDAMMSATPAKYLEPPAPEAADDAVELPPLAPPQEIDAESSMSQEEIDAILNAATSPPPAPATTPVEEPAVPEDVEVAEAANDVAKESAADAFLLDQAEIDKLARQVNMVETPAAVPEREEEPQRLVLGQDELDALVAGMSDDAPLVGRPMDAPLIAANEAISLSEANVESLLGSLGAVAEPLTIAEEVAAAPPIPEATPAPVSVPASAPPASEATAGSGDISQDMINALIAAAGAPGVATEDIGSENFAAAATAATAPETQAPAPTPAAPPEHDALDHLIEQSKVRQRQAAEAYAATDAAMPEKVRGMPRLDSPLWKFMRENGARAVASLAAGLLVAGGTFMYLYAQQQRVPDLAVLARQRGNELEEAMDAARKMIDEGECLRAATLLEEAMDAAPAGRERTDAAFLRLEALYKSVPDDAPIRRYDEVQTEIDGVLAAAPDHPRAVDALHWQALLHKRGELPFAALDNYELIIARHPEAEHMDEILLETARLALELGAPDKAARYADRVVQEFPQSKLYPEAKLVQGDAYARAGQRGAARQLYAESIEREADGPLRAEAVLRLGRLAFDEGDYDGAIKQIRDYLDTTTSATGNDAAYLLLAQAYRKSGRDAEARSVLNNLLHFFPDSKLSPEAYIELTQTLEELGERKGALQIASEGGERFPTDPKILKNLGLMLGLDGNPFSAATTLLAADEAGANDPEVLLTAGRHFRTAGMMDQAQAAYQKLLDNYGGSTESFLGGVELAELIYDRGDSKRALDRLENIATATEGKPQQLPALLAMAKIYDAIGLPMRVAEVSEKAAGLTDDPAVLARTAAALIRAGDLTEGQKVAERVDISQVPGDGAYTMLSAVGTALLEVDPPRGIEKLEEAYANYPDAREAENDFTLVQAYLDADRASGARRVVLDMAARVKDHPKDAPYLLDAATLWGDYLYAKNDFRGAADAYELADNTSMATGAQVVDGRRTPHDWPRYQRANALLKLADLSGSLALFTEIAQTKAPWAREAAVKADFVRLQQQLRGQAPTPAPAPKTTTAQAG